MIIEGIRYWENKEPGVWISQDIARYIKEKYGINVKHGYINDVRRSLGYGAEQRSRV